MIEFPVVALKEIGAAAEVELSYWQALFAAPGRVRMVDAGVVAVVLNAALEHGLVRLPAEQDETARADMDRKLDIFLNGSEACPVGNDDWCDLVEDEAEPVEPDHPSDEPLYYPPGVGTNEYYESFSDATAATLGPEHTLNTPLKPIGPLLDVSGAVEGLRKAARAIDGIGRPIGRDRLPDPDVARGRLAHAIAAGSDEARELVSLASRRPRTLAEVDEDDDSEPGHREMTPARRAQLDRLKHERRVAKETEGRRGKRGAILPTLEDVIGELKRQSMAGMMPTMAFFDGARPSNWATADAQMHRLEKTWSELAELADLKMRQRGRAVQPQAA